VIRLGYAFGASTNRYGTPDYSALPAELAAEARASLQAPGRTTLSGR
jgi:hypothetical protein